MVYLGTGTVQCTCTGTCKKAVFAQCRLITFSSALFCLLFRHKTIIYPVTVTMWRQFSLIASHSPNSPPQSKICQWAVLWCVACCYYMNTHHPIGGGPPHPVVLYHNNAPVWGETFRLQIPIEILRQGKLHTVIFRLYYI